MEPIIIPLHLGDALNQAMEEIDNDEYGEHMMGFFYEKEAAIQMVKDNAQDMYESCFPYALVEEVFPGLGCFRAEQRWAFKIDLKTRKYVEIEIPEYVTETVKMD